MVKCLKQGKYALPNAWLRLFKSHLGRYYASCDNVAVSDRFFEKKIVMSGYQNVEWDRATSLQVCLLLSRNASKGVITPFRKELLRNFKEVTKRIRKMLLRLFIRKYYSYDIFWKAMPERIHNLRFLPFFLYISSFFMFS